MNQFMACLFDFFLRFSWWMITVFWRISVIIVGIIELECSGDLTQDNNGRSLRRGLICGSSSAAKVIDV